MVDSGDDLSSLSSGGVASRLFFFCSVFLSLKTVDDAGLGSNVGQETAEQSQLCSCDKDWSVKRVKFGKKEEMRGRSPMNSKSGVQQRCRFMSYKCIC